MSLNIKHFKKLAKESISSTYRYDGDDWSDPDAGAKREGYILGAQAVLDELEKHAEFSIGYQYKENGPWDNDDGEVFTDLDEALGEFYAYRDTYLDDDTIVKRYSTPWNPVDTEPQ